MEITIKLTEVELNEKLAEVEAKGYRRALKEVVELEEDFKKCPIGCFDTCHISSPSEMYKAPCKGNMFCMSVQQSYNAIDTVLEQTKYFEPI